ncbi:uncharacterized protein MYCFIDRAFT_172649 [Pseudocercospora fijiensis CIRAD86]|uniref:Uncharacterized protein n=1 Tax=Pseudocercospora fijiensis (strain CIRAD86) TaxID=383855 RepID=M3A7A7_PSEFD|nr:uncharacterized protein MYCFIDRAFT_172649 [Pseudocercospora fijiensis CIRAD86]EME86974.1 hypothetical protein MYCFIDRAFT_172649 [Pseudocercospora fijiensis CIRAD86]
MVSPRPEPALGPRSTNNQGRFMNSHAQNGAPMTGGNSYMCAGTVVCCLPCVVAVSKCLVDMCTPWGTGHEHEHEHVRGSESGDRSTSRQLLRHITHPGHRSPSDSTDIGGERERGTRLSPTSASSSSNHYYLHFTATLHDYSSAHRTSHLRLTATLACHVSVPAPGPCLLLSRFKIGTPGFALPRTRLIWRLILGIRFRTARQHDSTTARWQLKQKLPVSLWQLASTCLHHILFYQLTDSQTEPQFLIKIQPTPMHQHDSPLGKHCDSPSFDTVKSACSQSSQGNISPYSPTSAAPHLQNICAVFIRAINERDLYPESPAWAENCHPNFTADHDCPVRKRKIIMNLKEWLRTKRDMIAGDCPEFRIEIPEQNTTIYQNERAAEVFLVVKSFGLIEGVVAQDVGVFEFKYGRGRWLATKYRGLRGLNDALSVYGAPDHSVTAGYFLSKEQDSLKHFILNWTCVRRDFHLLPEKFEHVSLDIGNTDQRPEIPRPAPQSSHIYSPHSRPFHRPRQVHLSSHLRITIHSSRHPSSNTLTANLINIIKQNFPNGWKNLIFIDMSLGAGLEELVCYHIHAMLGRKLMWLVKVREFNMEEEGRVEGYEFDGGYM